MRPSRKSSTSVTPPSYVIPCHLKSQSFANRCHSTCRSFSSDSSNGVIRHRYARAWADYLVSFAWPHNHSECDHTRLLPPVVPKNRIRTDSRDEAESAHPPRRCLRSSICLGRLSSICSGRGADLKSRTSFFGI